MWDISKTFDFCYGHRVWTQTLNTEYSLDSACVCRHLHGHQGKVIVHLTATELEKGMVTDFKHLNWFKKFLDDTFDHKFIIDKSDPLISTLMPDFDTSIEQFQTGGVNSNFRDIGSQEYGEPIWVPNLSCLQDKRKADHLIEMYEGYVVVNFVPTSEELSEFLHYIITNKMMKLHVYVSKVEFWETPKSCSRYIFDDGSGV